MLAMCVGKQLRWQVAQDTDTNMTATNPPMNPPMNPPTNPPMNPPTPITISSHSSRSLPTSTGELESELTLKI